MMRESRLMMLPLPKRRSISSRMARISRGDSLNRFAKSKPRSCKICRPQTIGFFI